MRTSLWARFQQLLPTSNITIGSVVSIQAEGTSIILTPEGNYIRALGTSVAVTNKAYVRDGRIIGQAPNLPVTNVSVM